MEIRIGLIKLDGGELGVVLRVHALITEDTADLIHAVHAADNEALEVQLRLDAEDHIHIQRVVVGIERARRRADLKRRQDRGIDLEIAAPIEEAAQLAQDKAALHERVLNVGVHDEVHIALAIAGLKIRQAMELVRQRQQSLGKQDDLVRAHGDLCGSARTSLRPSRRSSDRSGSGRQRPADRRT